jgi:large subunit ribosomal protein L10
LAISRARKEELLEAYRQQMAESSGFLMAEYAALSVPQMQAIRRRTREEGGELFVVKNTLFELVLQESDIKVTVEMTGPLVVAFAHKDVPSLAKLFREVAGSLEENRFVVRGGLLEGRFFDAREAAAVASLPTREELLAQVLRTINAPATQTVGVVAGGIRQVLNVVKAYADKLGEAAGGAETSDTEVTAEAAA